MGTSAQILTCPHCSKEFVAPAADGSTVVIEPDASSDADAAAADVSEDELNAIRIRQLAAGRRATYRARSYCVIAAGVCGMTAVQLAWLIARQTRAAGWDAQCSGYLLFALLALLGLGYFIHQAIQLHRESNRSALSEPTIAPDFSTLGDGSQRVKNLEDVR